MTTKLDGGPAFPRHGYADQPGMTLRDWFASQATDADIAAIRARHEHELGTKITREQVRYIHADAMLRAREVKP
jgi:hypothetical protein